MIIGNFLNRLNSGAKRPKGSIVKSKVDKFIRDDTFRIEHQSEIADIENRFLNNETMTEEEIDKMEEFNNRWLKQWLELYEDLVPNWVGVYNQIEEKKPKIVQNKIDVKKSIGTNEYLIDRIAKKAQNTPFSGLILSVMVTNRLAHVFHRELQDSVREWLNENNIDDSEFEETVAYMCRILNKTSSDVVREDSINALNRKGISEYLINKFNTPEMQKLEEYRGAAFELKTIQTDRTVRFLKALQLAHEGKPKTGNPDILKIEDIPEIPFGYFPDNSIPYLTKHALVVDMPNFSQFSVHVVDRSIIKSLKEVPYRYPIYEKETVLFTGQLSKREQNFQKKLFEIIEKDDSLTDEDVAIKLVESSKGYSSEEMKWYLHSSLVKTGFGFTTVLDMLHGVQRDITADALNDIIQNQQPPSVPQSGGQNRHETMIIKSEYKKLSSTVPKEDVKNVYNRIKRRTNSRKQ